MQYLPTIAGAAAAVAVLSSCGGGHPVPAGTAVAGAPTVRAASNGAPVPTPDALMDWAQGAFPGYFPGSAATQASAPYLYRYYPASGNYLGIDGDTVRVMGPSFGANPLTVGVLSDFACSVSPDACTQTVCDETTPWNAPYDIAVGNFRMANSWWGVSAGYVTPRSSFHQCMSGRPLWGTDAVSATWQWTFDANASISGLSGYPSIVYGLNPASASAPNTARGTQLPLRVGDIRNLSVAYDVQMSASGPVQTFFDLYFTRDAQPSVASMTHEVSISVRAPQWVGAHSKVATSTLMGHVFDIWVEPSLPGAPGAMQVVFVPQDGPVLTGTLRVRDVTDLLVSLGLMTSTQYLADIEFGTEPSGGQGTVQVNRYSVTAN